MWKVTLWKGTKRHEKARKGTSERKLGATYWVNMHQIMLQSGCCNQIAAWKRVESSRLLTWWAKKQFFLYDNFQECPPLRRGSVTHEDFIEFHWISLNFIEFHWIFTKIRPARSRLYQRIFEFFLRVRWEGAFNSQFLKEKRQNSKKKEREKFEWKLQKSWFLRIFRLWGGPKEAISTSFWILSSRWRRMQPNLGPGEEINQKFDEILVKKFGRS